MHLKDADGIEELWKFDLNGNKIYFKNSDGYERWYEYDLNANEIYFKNSNGYEEWSKYDENGNRTHYKNSDKYEEWRECPKTNGKNISEWECLLKYKEIERKMHFKNSRENGFRFFAKVSFLVLCQYLDDWFVGCDDDFELFIPDRYALVIHDAEYEWEVLEKNLSEN